MFKKASCNSHAIELFSIDNLSKFNGASAAEKLIGVAPPLLSTVENLSDNLNKI